MFMGGDADDKLQHQRIDYDTKAALKGVDNIDTEYDNPKLQSKDPQNERGNYPRSRIE